MNEFFLLNLSLLIESLLAKRSPALSSLWRRAANRTLWITISGYHTAWHCKVCTVASFLKMLRTLVFLEVRGGGGEHWLPSFRLWLKFSLAFTAWTNILFLFAYFIFVTRASWFLDSALVLHLPNILTISAGNFGALILVLFNVSTG